MSLLDVDSCFGFALADRKVYRIHDPPGEEDSDNDGIPDDVDNCPVVANPDQEDTDNDGIGDACDNCPFVPNPGQEDSYPPGGNQCGDACECEGDLDKDGDVDVHDVMKFGVTFGDFNCNGKIDENDKLILKNDVGRKDCPSCTVRKPSETT